MSYNNASLQGPATHRDDFNTMLERVIWLAFGITTLAQVCGCAYVDRRKDT
jgi:hypothetical protein